MLQTSPRESHIIEDTDKQTELDVPNICDKMTRWSVARVLTTFEMYSLILMASRTQIFASLEEEHVVDLDFQNSKFPGAMTVYSLAGSNALARSALLDRQEKLQENCDEIPDEEIHERDVLPEMFHHILVDEKHRLLYCYVPKVACTNWKRVLMIVTGKWAGNDPLEIPADKAHAAGSFVKLSNYSMPEIEEKLSTYNKFIVVRHPLERLLSAYRNKLETKNQNSSIYFQTRFGKRIVKKYRKNATEESLVKGDDVTFSEFVNFVTDSAKNGAQNEHWRPISELCLPCTVNYNLVSKYESLTEDATEVLERLGAGWLRFPTKPQRRESTSKQLDRYYSSLSLKQLRKLTDFYRLDLRLFDYSLEDVIGFSLA